MIKFTLSYLQLHDANHVDCLVRYIEMTVDHALIETGYSSQFWRDVELYGLREAYMYLDARALKVLKKDGLVSVKRALERAFFALCMDRKLSLDTESEDDDET